MTDPAVLLEVEDHVAVLTLNQPAKRNAFTPALVEELPHRIADVAANDAVRALVITGAGKGFCSGADFATLPSLAAGTGLEGSLAVHGAIERLYAAFVGISSLEIPTIAAVNGAAVGGGLGVALHCDIRLVAEDAKVGANFARLGIHPGLGITALLLRDVGYQAAAELLFSGRLIRGREAAAMGLFRAALPTAEVLPRARALASEIAGSAPLAVRWIKRNLQAASPMHLDETLRREALAQALLSESKDAAEGISARLAKREPNFKGR